MAHKRFTIEGETPTETIAKLEPLLPATATIADDFEGYVSISVRGAPYPVVHELVRTLLTNTYGWAAAAAALDHGRRPG